MPSITQRSTSDILQRFRNEVRIWSLLHRRGVDVVPLVGVYSTEAHPLGLIYEYMECLDLREYLRSGPNVERLKLVPDHLRALSINRLTHFGNSLHR